MYLTFPEARVQFLKKLPFHLHLQPPIFKKLIYRCSLVKEKGNNFKGREILLDYCRSYI